MRLFKTFFIVLIGHSLICDVGSFLLGRFTTVDWKLAIPIVILGAVVVTFLLEKPWRKGDKNAHS